MTDTELLTDAEIDLMASEVEEVRTPPIRAYWDARRIVATLQHLREKVILLEGGMAKPD